MCESQDRILPEQVDNLKFDDDVNTVHSFGYDKSKRELDEVSAVLFALAFRRP